jgi:transposase InsO family protein
MVIDMNESRLNTVAQLRAFLDGTLGVQFSPLNDDTQRYAFIGAVLRRLGYPKLRRPDKGVVLRYLEHTTGYSRQQLSRLVARAAAGAALVKRYRAPARPFVRKFGPADVALLAQLDALHGTLSGPATVHLLRRAYHVYGEAAFERLAGVSVSHLYNLRHSAGYRARRVHWTQTKRSAGPPIGERRAPNPQGRPGFIRIDSVHQGDLDGLKGVYHLNAVDCLTQFELVASCERISEAYLLPVLQSLLEDFPFPILGFHADNGSEYINYTVARLLDKLRVEQFTKSRPGHSNDNALVETKNGAIVRKHLGYAHLAQRFAPQINAFCREHLNPYVNFHRPCFFPEVHLDAKGRVRKRYRFADMMTPYEKLKSLPDAERFLKPGMSFAALDAYARASSDNEVAARMNAARAKLFQFIERRSRQQAA